MNQCTFSEEEDVGFIPYWWENGSSIRICKLAKETTSSWFVDDADEFVDVDEALPMEIAMALENPSDDELELEAYVLMNEQVNAADLEAKLQLLHNVDTLEINLENDHAMIKKTEDLIAKVKQEMVLNNATIVKAADIMITKAEQQHTESCYLALLDNIKIIKAAYYIRKGLRHYFQLDGDDGMLIKAADIIAKEEQNQSGTK